MLDFRIATFLTLCETRSYTQTAKMLNITQPSVTQHIKHLQKKYHCVLFHYESKTLHLTQEGEYLQAHAKAMTRMSAKIISDLQRMGEADEALRLGFPGEIGEIVMTRIVTELMQTGSVRKIDFVIENTSELLKMLENSELDVVLTDARFLNKHFQNASMGEVTFAAYAAPELAAEYDQCALEMLFENALLLQNPGTSAREILECCLAEREAFPESFADKMTAGSDICLQELAMAQMGILFAYASSVREAVTENRLQQIAVSDFSEQRSLVFQYRENNREKQKFPTFFEEFKQAWNRML